MTPDDDHPKGAKSGELFPDQIFLRAKNYLQYFELQGREKIRLKKEE